MKKIKSLFCFVSVIVTMVCLTGLGSACSQIKNALYFNSNMLKDCYVNFTNAISVGIVTKPSKESVKTEKENGDKKNYMVTFDEENKISEVIFYRTANGKEKEITQEQLSGQINKLYVTDEFTYMQFVTDDNQYDSSQDDFNKKYYNCNETSQSFVIHNESGKVYSMENVLPYFNIISYNLLYHDYKYYILKNEGNDLIVEDLIANKNIQVDHAFADKYGNFFIQNRQTDEISGNRIFYTVSGLDNEHYLGNDGQAYVADYVGTDYSAKYIFKYYNENAQLLPVAENTFESLNPMESSYSWLLHGKFVYQIWQALCTDVYAWNESIKSYEFASDIEGENFTAINNELVGFLHDSNDLYHFIHYMEGSQHQYNKIKIMTATGIKNMGSYAEITVETAESTLKYKLWFEGGEAKTELMDETTYDYNIIVVQPLN